MNNKKVSDLEFYRGVSSIIVLIGHIFQIYWVPAVGYGTPAHHVLGTLARYSVIIFFLLSGYLITKSIITNFRTHNSFDWQDYLSARVARIYPPLMFSVLLVAVLALAIKSFNLHGYISYRLPTDQAMDISPFSISTLEVLGSIFLLNGVTDVPFFAVNPPLWSLGMEFTFYVLAMFVAMLWTDNNRAAGLVGVLVLTACIVYFKKYGLLNCALFWLIGSLLATPANFRHSRRWRAAYRACVIGSFVYILAILSLDYRLLSVISSGSENSTMTRVLAKGTQLAFAFVVSSFIFRTYNNPVWTMLVDRLQGTAKYSYTLYVLHFPLLMFTFSFLHQPLIDGSSWTRLSVSMILFFGIISIARYLSSPLENVGIYRAALSKAFAKTAANSRIV